MGNPLRIVIFAPEEKIPVEIGESVFEVRPVTGRLHEEVEATLARRFPDSAIPADEREREFFRAMLVGARGIILSDGRDVEWAKGCPICGGKGTRGDLPVAGSPAVPPTCVACRGSGDVRDFYYLCLPLSTRGRISSEAMRQFRREAERLKN